MNEVYVANKRLRLQPSMARGKGQEAEIFEINPRLALKLYKPPNHVDYMNEPAEQQAARERLASYQKKLPAFPQSLPGAVIKPMDLATDRPGGKIIGYTMPFLGGAELLFRYYFDPDFRHRQDANDIVAIFRNLHPTIMGVHGAGVVIGDFNDLNVLVKDGQAYLIDTDSFQYGGFICRMFTDRFVDPLLCDPKASSPMLVKPHNPLSDWYAFGVMLWQSLLLVDPYGGVYVPKRAADRVPHPARPLKRISVFHPEVRYKKSAIPFGVLPDDLLDFFRLTFEKNKRGIFPLALLDNLRWTKCTRCGTAHARAVCPQCAFAAPAAVKETTVIRGQVTATTIFTTSGQIVCATMENGQMRYLYCQNNVWKRDNNRMVEISAPPASARFRLCGEATMVGIGPRLRLYASDDASTELATDCYRTLPVFDANASHYYWIQNGQLLRSSALGAEYIGDVMPEQTLFWAGAKFGFGFYRAGNMNVSFLFESDKRGINDTVKVPFLSGQLVDSSCVFGSDRAWFFTATRVGGKTINQCVVMNRAGTVLGKYQTPADDGSWLGSIRGKCGVNDFLLAPTDNGIVRVEVAANSLTVSKEFPDTEPFVNAASQLYAGTDGLYVVNRQAIVRLQIR